MKVLGDGAEFLGVWAGAAAAESLAAELFGEAATLTITPFGLAEGVIAELTIARLIEGLRGILSEVLNTQQVHDARVIPSQALTNRIGRMRCGRHTSRGHVYKVKLLDVDLGLDD